MVKVLGYRIRVLIYVVVGHVVKANWYFYKYLPAIKYPKLKYTLTASIGNIILN